MPTVQSTYDVNERLAVMETNVSSLRSLHEKYSVSLEKLTELIGAVKQIVTIHELKVTALEKKQDMFVDDLKELSSKIDSFINESVINQRESERRIELLEDSNQALKKTLETNLNSIITAIKELKLEKNAETKTFMDRLREVELWKAMLVGGGIVLAFFIGELDITKLFGK